MNYTIFKNKPGEKNEIDCHLGCREWKLIESYTDIPYIVDVVWCDKYERGKTKNRCLNYNLSDNKYSPKNTGR